MSYCRWSSDDWQCDVYVWADVRGTWRTEVAGRRWIFDVELPPQVDLPHPFTEEQFHAWYQRHDVVTDMLEDESSGHWFDLPTPEGGNSYEHDTPGECAANLERLRDSGLNVPQHVIDNLRAEHEALV